MQLPADGEHTVGDDAQPAGHVHPPEPHTAEQLHELEQSTPPPHEGLPEHWIEHAPGPHAIAPVHVIVAVHWISQRSLEQVIDALHAFWAMQRTRQLDALPQSIPCPHDDIPQMIEHGMPVGHWIPERHSNVPEQSNTQRPSMQVPPALVHAAG